MSSRTKNQHYVAQLYLRRFAFERCKKGARIHVFDKTTGRSFATNTRNVSAELNFYEETDIGIEKALQQLEDLFAPVYSRLLEVDTVDALTIDERVIAGMFVALQQVRTKEHRVVSDSIVTATKEALASRGLPVDLPQLRELSSEEMRSLHADHIRTLVPHIGEIAVRMKWVLVLNDTRLPFWTSDHPVTMYNPLPRDLAGNTGWKCSGIQAFFPLSPLRALSLCDPQLYGGLPGVLRTCDAQNVTFNNHLQIQSSTRYLFANHGDFRFAKDVLEEQPMYADPKRPRIASS